MPTDVIMPKLGLTMETGTVQRWLVAEGQLAEAGSPLLEIETDKVVVEVESPVSGTLGSQIVAEGQTVPIGTVLAWIYAPGEQRADAAPGEHLGPAPAEPAPSPSPPSPITPPARDVAAGAAVRLDEVREKAPSERVAARDVQVAGRPGRAFSSPRARKRAREAGLDWHTVPGSGPLGRVIERDVSKAVAMERPAARDDERSSGIGRPSFGGDVTWETPSLIERVAAGRMAASFSSAPYFYLSAETRADALLELHERLLPVIEGRAGVRLTLTDLLVKIVATTLAEHPRANAFWDPTEGGRIGLHRQIHVGIAVATGAGLVVPVLRNADGMGLAQMASERNRLVEKAQKGKLLPDDLEGSTFTLTNLGMHRVDVFQAILSPPQSAILAVGRIAERPVTIEGQLCVRPTMVLTLSCDHRVLDGFLGAQFLGRVVELIEAPYELIA